MVSIDVLALIGGVVYGFVNPGKEHKTKLLKKGAMIGLGIGVVLSVLNLVLGGGLLVATATVFGTIIAIVYLTIMFIVGAYAGDWLELRFKK
jgi:hypothetical protein